MYISYFKVMQIMHYIFWAKYNALQFSKSNANAFALHFGKLVERSGIGMGRVPFFWRGTGLGSFFLAWDGSRVLKILLGSTSGPNFPLNIIQI